MKKFANRHGYSDVEPYEVIREISDKTLEVRRMRYERDPTWKPEFIAGGYAGHCTNQNTQRWIITSDEGAQVVRIRKPKKGTYWKDKFGNQFALSDEPRRFYDYNF